MMCCDIIVWCRTCSIYVWRHRQLDLVWNPDGHLFLRGMSRECVRTGPLSPRRDLLLHLTGWEQGREEDKKLHAVYFRIMVRTSKLGCATIHSSSRSQWLWMWSCVIPGFWLMPGIHIAVIMMISARSHLKELGMIYEWCFSLPGTWTLSWAVTGLKVPHIGSSLFLH